MNDWEVLCPQVWKAKYIDCKIDNQPSEAMMYGSWFETIAIGSGVNGKVTEPTPSMAKSAYAPRVKKQAEDCQAYFKSLGGKIISTQEYIYTSVIDGDGQEILVCGGLDVLYGFPDNDEKDDIIIDLKFNGDTDNDFGPYQFGNPERVNPQQGVHYKMLYKAKYGKDCGFEWWVFDKSPTMKQKRISLDVSEISNLLHLEKVSRIYNEITFAIAMDDWEYKNSFDNCRNCPVKCQYERKLPEIYELTV